MTPRPSAQLQALRSAYRAQGYTLREGAEVGGYRVEAVATRGGAQPATVMMVERGRPGAEEAERLEALSLLAAKKGWDLRVVMPEAAAPEIAAPHAEDLGKARASVEFLRSAGDEAGALLIAFAALQAGARLLAEEGREARAVCAGALVQDLVSFGAAPQEDLEALIRLAQAHDRAAAGDLQVQVYPASWAAYERAHETLSRRAHGAAPQTTGGAGGFLKRLFGRGTPKTYAKR